MLWILLSTAFAQSSGSFLSPGPLARAHEDLDTVTQCTACHAPFRGSIRRAAWRATSA
ncbi:MAG: hypothetical protein R3F61_29355 [Myxococcota bacterium]